MNIILAITGSISCYKMIDVAKTLKSRGFGVKVILSRSVAEFINPKIFAYFNIECYQYNEDFENIKDLNDDSSVNHISLARWCDKFVLAPATANKIAELSQGLCNDLMSSVYLSLDENKTKLIFPAMNTKMLDNTITQRNFESLSLQRNTYIFPTEEGLLACGEKGKGKLLSHGDLCDLIESTSSLNSKKKVVITAGATIAPIDTVRYITNPAKGGSAYLLAKKYLKEGYSVHVIKGKNVIASFKHLEKHPQYTSETVVTTEDLSRAVAKHYSSMDIYISPMAVSDIAVKMTDKKIKKKNLEPIQITIANDVLKEVLDNKKKRCLVVGFAAESDLSEEVLNEKLKRKPVDLLVANKVNSGLGKGKAQGFGTREGTYVLRSKKEVSYMQDINKADLVEIIFEKVSKLTI